MQPDELSDYRDVVSDADRSNHMSTLKGASNRMTGGVQTSSIETKSDVHSEDGHEQVNASVCTTVALQIIHLALS